MRFSILIVQHNESEKIKQTLECCFAQNFPRDQYEIIVIDDNSNDGSFEIAKSFGVKVIRVDEHIGVSETRRMGVKLCKGDIIIFIDAHLYLFDKNSFSSISDAFIKNPKVAGICGHYRSLEENDLYQFRDIRRETIFHKVDKEITIDLKHFTTFSSVICAIRRSIFEHVNFTEGLRNSGGEDTYLQLQIHKLGYNFKYIPSIVGVHDRPQDIRGILGKMMIEVRGTANILFYSARDKVEVPFLNFFLSYPLTIVLGLLLLPFFKIFSLVLILVTLISEIILILPCLKAKNYSLGIRVGAAIYSFVKEIFGIFYIPFYLLKKRVSFRQIIRIIKITFNWEVARWRSFFIL